MHVIHTEPYGAHKDLQVEAFQERRDGKSLQERSYGGISPGVVLSQTQSRRIRSKRGNRPTGLDIRCSPGLRFSISSAT